MPIPPGYDWQFAYRPAALALLSGHSPYDITTERFTNAPWGLFPLIPLAVLPVEWGRLLLILISLAAFAFVAYKLKATPIAMIAFLLSPFVFRCLWYGQIDWIPLLSILMPPWLGLFFIAVKPQVCLFVVAYWLAEAWKAGMIIKTFTPVTIATLVSFAMFGFWPANAAVFGRAGAMWPWSIALSVALLFVAYKRKDKTAAAAASPLASPYAQLHSFIGILLPLMRYQWLMVLAVVLLWIAEFVK